MTTTQIKKNITLSEKFSSYMMKHPNKFKGIAKNARIIVVPKNDKKLEKENMKIAEKVRSGDSVYIATEIGNGWQMKRI